MAPPLVPSVAGEDRRGVGLHETDPVDRLGPQEAERPHLRIEGVAADRVPSYQETRDEGLSSITGKVGDGCLTVVAIRDQEAAVTDLAWGACSAVQT
jgi:hypothetical protein